MGYTHLTPTGTPGRPHSFSAKTEATAVLKGVGLFTRLSVLGTPGKGHTFTAKTPAAGVGHFTRLSVLGTPGKGHIFTAKTPATALPKGIGPFTRLSVLGTPGRIHSFSGKTEAEVIDIGVIRPSGGGGGQVGIIVPRSQSRALDLQRDDQDILEFIIAFVLG